MLRCTSLICTSHGNALSDKKLHSDQKMANSHCFAQGRALGSISRRKPKQLTPRHISQIAVKNLTPAPENAWALHPLLLASFLNLGGCTSKLNLPKLVIVSPFLRNFCCFSANFQTYQNLQSYLPLRK